MSVIDHDELNNAVRADEDDDGACHDPDFQSPSASGTSSECNVGETSTEDEDDLSPDSGDESLSVEDAFSDAAMAQAARISYDEVDDVECEDHYEELNSFAMASQGNIHTLAVFPRPGYGNTGHNLLVATLSRQVYTMGFVEYDPQKRKVEDLRFDLRSRSMINANYLLIISPHCRILAIWSDLQNITLQIREKSVSYQNCDLCLVLFSTDLRGKCRQSPLRASWTAGDTTRPRSTGSTRSASP